MPRIELIPVPLYQSNQPYNSEQDNIPIKALIDRILLVNNQVDINANVLRESIGTVGSLAARLAASLEDDGGLKSSAIDNSLHNIAYHIDGSIVISGIPYSYVRMTSEERDKLALISDDANHLQLRVEIDGSIPSNISGISSISQIGYEEVLFYDGEIKLKPSDAITWKIDEEGALLAETTFPAAARHRHYYDVTPTHQDILSPNYQDYEVAYPYKEGSLRVYINGVRISKDGTVYVPTDFGISGPTWVAYSYTEDTATSGEVLTGRFSLSASIGASEEIRVDFDALYS